MVQMVYSQPQRGGTLGDVLGGIGEGISTGVNAYAKIKGLQLEQQRTEANISYNQGMLDIQKQQAVLKTYETARNMVGATLDGSYGDMSPAEVEMIVKTGLSGTKLPPEAVDAYGRIARSNSEFARKFREQMASTFDDPQKAAEFENATRAGGVAGGMQWLDGEYKRRREDERHALEQQYKQSQIEHEQAQTYRQYNPVARGTTTGGGGGGAGRGRASTPSYLKTTLWDENGNETEGFIDRGTGIVHVIENGRLVPINQAGQAPAPQAPQAPVPQAMPQAPRTVPQAPGAMPQAPGPQMPAPPQAMPQAPVPQPPIAPERRGGGATGSWDEEPASQGAVPQAPSPQTAPAQQPKYTTTKPQQQAQGGGTPKLTEQQATARTRYTAATNAMNDMMEIIGEGFQPGYRSEFVETSKRIIGNIPWLGNSLQPIGDWMSQLQGDDYRRFASAQETVLQQIIRAETGAGGGEGAGVAEQISRRYRITANDTPAVAAQKLKAMYDYIQGLKQVAGPAGGLPELHPMPKYGENTPPPRPPLANQSINPQPKQEEPYKPWYAQ